MQRARVDQPVTGPAERRTGQEAPPASREAGAGESLFWRNVRMIAAVRVLLALATILAVYVDPNLPPGGHWLRIAIADASLLLLLLYALAVWRWQLSAAAPASLPQVTIWLDVFFSALLVGSTGAHQSPLYLWIIFTIVSAALKSGWGTAIRVCVAQLILYLYVGIYLPDLGGSEFVLFGFLARTLLLFAVALLLAHMGQRLQEQNRMLAGLHSAVAHMSAGHSTAEVLGRIADSLTDLLEVEQVAVSVWDPNADGSQVAVVNIPRRQAELLLADARRWVSTPPPASSFVLVSNAPAADSRLPATPGALEGVRSLLVVRFPGSRECPGLLVACNRLGERGFGPADQELAELLAAQAGPLLETARLQEQRRFDAGSDERRRIAAELHDGLIQTLAGLDLRLLSCRELWRGRQWEPLGDELGTLEQLVGEALGEARGAINELAPVRLRLEGLAAFLEGLVLQFQERAGLPVATSIDLAEADAPSGSIPEPAALLVIGLLREGLNNIRKHSQATHVTLSVARSGPEIRFQLTDDGVGFCPGHPGQRPAPMRHYGLAYLCERVTAAGGSLQVISRPGAGTILEAELPLLTEEPLA